MSEARKKFRNFPSYFTDPISLIPYLSSTDIRGGNCIQEAKNKKKYENWGNGGIPIFYNRENHKLYMDYTDRHTLILGSTGSKKSRLIAMPTVRLLGKSKESMIICDPKAEIYYRTASFLEKEGISVKVINLRNAIEGEGWNPLYVPFKYYLNGQYDLAYEHANDIAVNLSSMDQYVKDPFWDMSAGSFMFGLILLLFKYCVEHKEPIDAVNIGNVFQLRNLLCNGPNGSDINQDLWEYAQTDYFIKSALIGTVTTAERTRGGILSTFDQKMRVFSIQPSLLGLLSYNDIIYDELLDTPTAVFLILPDEKTAFHRLVSLFVKQSYECLIREIQERRNNGRQEGLRINYILDEFSSLPRISDFPSMVTAARSRNIRFNLFLQSKHQLKLRYSEESNTIMDNCDNWIFLTSKEVEVLEEISSLCGFVGNEQKKRLLTITDLQRLDKERGEALIISGRNKPMITELADIDEYDNGHYDYPTSPKNDTRKWTPLDFKTNKFVENNNKPDFSLDDLFDEHFDKNKPTSNMTQEDNTQTLHDPFNAISPQIEAVNSEISRENDEHSSTNDDTSDIDDEELSRRLKELFKSIND